SGGDERVDQHDAVGRLEVDAAHVLLPLLVVAGPPPQAGLDPRDVHAAMLVGVGEIDAMPPGRRGLVRPPSSSDGCSGLGHTSWRIVGRAESETWKGEVDARQVTGAHGTFPGLPASW